VLVPAASGHSHPNHPAARCIAHDMTLYLREAARCHAHCLAAPRAPKQQPQWACHLAGILHATPSLR